MRQLSPVGTFRWQVNLASLSASWERSQVATDLREATLVPEAS
jgi:hypothetical protein